MTLRALLLAAALVLAMPADAGARSERTIGWTAARVFPTAVRFLRIDEHATIIEKDADAGYVIFDLPDEGKVYRGALELAVTSDDPPRLRLVLHIDDRPDYMEIGMLDRLERKLRDELGTPPKPAPKPAPKPKKPVDPPAP